MARPPGMACPVELEKGLLVEFGGGLWVARAPQQESVDPLLVTVEEHSIGLRIAVLHVPHQILVAEVLQARRIIVGEP